MSKIKKKDLEYRHYQMPNNMYVFALLGDTWFREYGVNKAGKEIKSLHFHNFLEVGYCEYGTGEMIFGDIVHPYKKDNFTIIPSRYPHTTNSTKGSKSKWQYLFIDVKSILKSLYTDSKKLKVMDTIIEIINSEALFLNTIEDKSIADNIKRIMNILSHKQIFYEEEAHASVISLLIKIARKIESKRECSFDEFKPYLVSSKFSDVVSKAIEYISDNYTKDIKVSELASYLYMSEVHLRRVFDRYMSIGVLEYINLVRISEACKMLKNSTKTINAIANSCGFNDISTFNRNFKRFVGYSPNIWRKDIKNYEYTLLKYKIHTEEGWW